ncbi:MAG: hypothetical protein AAFW73_05660 [Bacteroidota bacterium]
MKYLISTLSCLLLLTAVWANNDPAADPLIVLSPWEINDGKGQIPLGDIDMHKQHGNPIVYQLSSRPDKMDPNWKPAPMRGNDVAMIRSSNVPCFQAVDFTYFRAFLDVSADATFDHLTVTIGAVDDGARMFIYNSAYPNGHFDPATDGRLGGKSFTVDFKDEIVPGEINTIMIVQVDDCRTENNLTGGLTLKVNDTKIAPDPNWKADHTRFTKKKKYASPAVRFIPKSNWSFQGDGQFENVDLRIRPDGKGTLFIPGEAEEFPFNYVEENGKFIFSGTDPDDGTVHRFEVTRADKNELHLKDLTTGTVHIAGRKRSVSYKNLENTAWLVTMNGIRQEMIFLPNKQIVIENQSTGDSYLASYVLEDKTIVMTLSQEAIIKLEADFSTIQVDVREFDYFTLVTQQQGEGHEPVKYQRELE